MPITTLHIDRHWKKFNFLATIPFWIEPVSDMSTWIPTLLREIGANPPPSIPDESLLSAALTDIILGVATHAQSAALLTCLHFTKLDHNAHVISAFAKTMREHALKVHRADLGKNVPSDEYLVDIVGTGGDGWGTFNASTSAAIIAAGAGCYICKVVLPLRFN